MDDPSSYAAAKQAASDAFGNPVGIAEDLEEIDISGLANDPLD